MRAHTIALLLLLVFGLVGGVVLYFYTPESLAIPRCPFLLLTGWQCPGCGSLRGIHALLHGDLAQVLQLNLMLIPGLLYMILLFGLELLRLRSTKAERLYHLFSGSVATWTTLSIIVLWSVVRNII